MSGPVGIIAFVVSIIVAILLHELGHLLTAKRFGMRADRYFVGFGPTLWSTRRGETEYGVKAFILGGFVRIVGMTPLDERRRPVLDAAFDPEALQRDRRLAAKRAGSDDPLDQPNLPVPTWERLRSLLEERGVTSDTIEHVVRRTQANLPEHPTVADGRRVLNEVLVTEIGHTQRLGDLPYRVFEGDRGRFFHDRPAWQRAIVLVTGPLTHVAIAVVALLSIYLFFSHAEVVPVVDEVLDDTPAAEAGMQPGDRLVAVDGLHSSRYPVLRDAIRARPGETIELQVEREGVPTTLTLTPREEVDEVTGETFGFVGFAPLLEDVEFGVVAALRHSVVGDPTAYVTAPGGVIPIIGASVEGLARVFSPQGLSNLLSTAVGQTERGAETPMSLVGAAAIAGQAGEGPSGWIFLLFLIAVVNAFFFVFNLVPLPPFDGGHLAVLGIEKAVNLVRAARGRAQDFSVDPRAIVAVTLPVLIVLGTVLIATLWLDIYDPIQLG
jgi:regulator of sigma E protease